MDPRRDRGDRRFSSPVDVPLVGSNEDARAVRDLAASVPVVEGLGGAVDGEEAGIEWSVVGSQWSDKMSRLSFSSRIDGDLPPTAAATASRRRRPGAVSSRSVRPRSRGGRAHQDGHNAGVDDDDTLFRDLDEQPQAPPSRRARRGAQVATAGQDAVVDALVPCLQRAGGLPVSTTIESRRAGVSAAIVTHPTSSSHCIVLRSGTGKTENAVLWLSSRGGVLCSCFLGAQNAVLLSAFSRSLACKHVSIMEKAMVVAGVSQTMLVDRMRRPIDATELAVPRQYGLAVI